MRGRDLRLHHQHQVQQVAKGGVQCPEDPSEEVHTRDPVPKGPSRALRTVRQVVKLKSNLVDATLLLRMWGPSWSPGMSDGVADNPRRETRGAVHS